MQFTPFWSFFLLKSCHLMSKLLITLTELTSYSERLLCSWWRQMYSGVETRAVQSILYSAFSLRHVELCISVTFLWSRLFSLVSHWFLPFPSQFCTSFDLSTISVALCSQVSSVSVPSSPLCSLGFPLWFLLRTVVLLLFFVALYALSNYLTLFSTALSVSAKVISRYVLSLSHFYCLRALVYVSWSIHLYISLAF